MKRITPIFVIVLIMFLAAACGSPAPAATQAPAQPAATEAPPAAGNGTRWMLHLLIIPSTLP
jgi:hypothetical protein